jgi:antitoxin HicB
MPTEAPEMKLEYAVRIDRLAESYGGGYLATVPELPGCMSDGATPEDAPKPGPPLARAG